MAAAQAGLAEAWARLEALVHPPADPAASPNGNGGGEGKGGGVLALVAVSALAADASKT